MRIESLQYFVVTANMKNITAASQVLHVSQQNLSKEILKLEEELGVKLFIRTKRGVRLTEDGMKGYALANDILQRVNEFMNLYTEMETLSISYFTPLAAHVRIIIDSLEVLHKNVSIMEYSISYAYLLSELSSGKLDILLYQIEKDVFKKINNESSEYDHYILCEEPILLCFSSPYSQTIFDPKDFPKYSFCFYKADSADKPLYEEIVTKYGGKTLSANRNLERQYERFFNTPNAALITTKSITPDYLKSNDHYWMNANIKERMYIVLSIKKELTEKTYVNNVVNLLKEYFSKYDNPEN